MLELKIDDVNGWDEANETFVYAKGQTLHLEHSLVSVSKWEKKWKVSFLRCLEKQQLNIEQTIDYVRCMTIDKNVNDLLYRYGLTNSHIAKVNEYLADPMTATYIPERPMQPGGRSGDTPTSEMIYYYMISYNIPVEFEKWPLNRLITLIKICEVKNNPSKNKMSAAELAKHNTRLNAERCAAMNTKG